MSNHPNRGLRSPQANPSPAEIIALRHTHQLTQTEAAALIWCGLGAIQKWEAGTRRMHPVFWWALKTRIQQTITRLSGH